MARRKWPVVFILTTGCLLWLCTSKPSNNSSPKFEQYFVKGEQLYSAHCSNCHQKNGKGLGKLYPPLDTSDYMSDSLGKVLCLIRYGKSGEIIVNGKSYNQPMPGIAELTDLEIAEIATYIYNSWTHQKGIIDVKETSKALSNCRDL
ncbi:MAG TPA: cytochrome c [Chryseolinea sp.]|nr:cytochrome c [Chryseolinea sp.]